AGRHGVGQDTFDALLRGDVHVGLDQSRRNDLAPCVHHALRAVLRFEVFASADFENTVATDCDDAVPQDATPRVNSKDYPTSGQQVTASGVGQRGLLPNAGMTSCAKRWSVRILSRAMRKSSKWRIPRSSALRMRWMTCSGGPASASWSTISS